VQPDGQSCVVGLQPWTLGFCVRSHIWQVQPADARAYMRTPRQNTPLNNLPAPVNCPALIRANTGFGNEATLLQQLFLGKLLASLECAHAPRHTEEFHMHVLKRHCTCAHLYTNCMPCFEGSSWAPAAQHHDVVHGPDLMMLQHQLLCIDPCLTD
jgi:hypothetical protein